MRLIIIFSLCISIFSCRREENREITVNGQVINRITGQPIPNVKVKLYNCENSSFYIGTCNTVSTVYTDMNGRFTFQYTKNPGRYYSCELNENNYYSSNPDYGINNRVELSSNSAQTIQLNAAPNCGIKLKIYNTSCFDTNDHFILFRQNQISNFYWGSPFEMNACTSHEGLSFGAFPMGNYYFHWQVTKNSVTQDFYDTLYLNAFQDTIYTINY